MPTAAKEENEGYFPFPLTYPGVIDEKQHNSSNDESILKSSEKDQSTVPGHNMKSF